ncbi:MAG: SbmA/BacA-like family transporter, partial [Cyanobacteriota bacterium]
MPSPDQGTSLLSFASELQRFAAVFLLPPTRRRAWLHWFGLLVAAALVAASLAALLLAGGAQLLDRALGQELRTLVFPYLDPVLSLATPPQVPIALAVALAALGALRLQTGRLGSLLGRRWWALAGLLLLLMLATAVDVAFTEGNGAVMDALNLRSARRFWSTAAGLGSLYLLTLPLQFLNDYGQQRWALAWRQSTTAGIEEGYLRDRAYYHLETAASGAEAIDNPDQRLAEDVQRSVASATGLFFGFCASLLALAAYLLVVFRISGWLVLSLLIATCLGNGLIGRMVRRLAQLGFRQQGLEADYRFALIHLRSNAESIAFLGGERSLGRGLRARFGRLLRNQERLLRWRVLVAQGSGLYAFLMHFVPYLVLSTAYFGGAVSLGDLTVGSIAFGQVQGSLSFLIDRADDVSGLVASLHRVSTLAAAVERPAAARPDPPPHAVLRLEAVRLEDPCSGRALVEALDLCVEPGLRLLVSGPSGCGKTSLLRTLCGLVQPAAGLLQPPDPQRLLVLPQKPFLPLGSLREQLL